jgi:ankyrin repeat protein
LVDAGFPLWIMSYVLGNGNNTPVHTAAAQGHYQMVDYLISLFGDKDFKFNQCTINKAGQKYYEMFP